MTERVYWTAFWSSILAASMITGYVIFDAIHLIQHHAL